MNTQTFSRSFASFHVQVILLSALLLVLLAGYIIQVNAASTEAYALRDATHIHEALARNNSRLAAQADHLRSLSSMRDRAKFLDLVPVGALTYLEINHHEALAIK